MKLLKCKLCSGEVDIIGNYKAVNKKIKCKKCHFTNLKENENNKKPTEVIVIKTK